MSYARGVICRFRFEAGSVVPKRAEALTPASGIENGRSCGGAKSDQCDPEDEPVEEAEEDQKEARECEEEAAGQEVEETQEAGEEAEVAASWSIVVCEV